jgi:adenylate cyclase
MAEARVQRRLAAILAADVAGYSRLMGSDDEATLAGLKACREVIALNSKRHHGRIVNTPGDSALVEFASAVDATRCAIEIQKEMAQRNAAIPEDRRLEIRIGINVGDIIIDEGEIYGDGVNIAARVESLASPGGICLSENAYQQIKGKLTLNASNMGARQLKNIAEPVRVYSVQPDAPARPTLAFPDRPSIAVLLPSIAVLPLRNQVEDPADDYFCDGIVEDVILSLASFHELMVISRSSTLAYRGGQADPRQVGRDLGVRYVMSGTVRRSEKLVRVSVELSDAVSGATLWGEKADVPPGELFELQDHIVRRVVAGIAPNVRAAEMRALMRKRPESFTAYDYTLRGLHIINSLDKKTFLQAREFLDRAMVEDAHFAMPVAWAGRWYSMYVGQGWSANPAEDRIKAIDLAAKAIDLDPDNALALATFAHLKAYLSHDYDSALNYFERALTASPNHSLAWLLSAGTLSYIGQTKKAIEHAQRGLRLSPFDRGLYYYYMFLTLAYYADGAYEEALKWGRLAFNQNPMYTATHRFFAAALVATGNQAEAREVAAAMMRLEPDFRLSTYVGTRQPFRAPELRDRLLDHLRQAGFPD